jgi:hypothetical protein
MSWLKSFFNSDKSAKDEVGTTLEMVTYVAGLAANPDAIDGLLDAVRHITSRLQPGQLPTQADDEALMAVYLELESYLTTKEPIRAYTKEQLRQRLSPILQQRLVTYETGQNRQPVSEP